jgi:hypothetical protein
VRKSFVGFFCLLGLASGLATNGCGGSGGSADTGGTYATALGSCSDYCERYFAACHPPAYSDDGFCKIDLCSPIPQMASADCYSATKSWYDCRKTQADLCGDTGCTNQAAAAASACP